jgi:hypothetical protein
LFGPIHSARREIKRRAGLLILFGGTILAKKIAAKFGENKTPTKYGYKFGGKIWRENLAGKFGGKNLEGKIWREKIGGKSWQRIGRKLAGNFKIWREN